MENPAQFCTENNKSASRSLYWRAVPPPITVMLRLRFSHLYRSGAPDRIRTHDPQIRSLVLYPAELRALTGLSVV